MPKRTDIKTIFIIGSGPIIIGQACEFDYSGVQACKALREDGYKVILINPNPATIMTDPEIADKVYIEPIETTILTDIIIKHKPDALLPTMGGQTALNAAMELEKKGVLKKFNVELIGAASESIKKAEDRKIFQKSMQNIGVDVPKSFSLNQFTEMDQFIDTLQFPVIVRSSFTLGGKGGHIIKEKTDCYEHIKRALNSSPIKQALVEEYLEGWKEFELEMMRDSGDNCVVICSIENINPMGVHTGDSITVAPALTLTDKEFQNMRNIAIKVMREINISAGGANVQFAVNPKNGRVVVIEINPRVSRSSALASKATGFPIAKISAKLAVGYTLDEIPNDITKKTYAAFEPTLDYVVTKIPRFSFEKFPKSNPYLGPSMKSIGEVMAIGRNFAESFQKAIISLEKDLTGLDKPPSFSNSKEEQLKKIIHFLMNPTELQFLYVSEAFRLGLSIEQVHQYTQYDFWFLEQIRNLVSIEDLISSQKKSITKEDMKYIKSMGFSNKRIASLTKQSIDDVNDYMNTHNILPVYKRVDTCAAEFSSSTPYLYSTHEVNYSNADNCEANISDKEKIIILGSGPNRIGQGIEFDYCCVQASIALKELGYETIMVNCNPETVSTDYTVSDRLYFEPLDSEYVLNLIKKEKSKGKLKGVITQLGGQTPLSLISILEKEKIPLLGTSAKSIDLAENRKKFSEILLKEGFEQPINFSAHNKEELISFSKKIQYPVILRPSYVIGGQNMQVATKESELHHLLEKEDYLKTLSSGPILVEQYLENAKEIDVDAIYDGKTIVFAGITEHFESAGIHSGDSTCSLPTHSLKKEIISSIKNTTLALCKLLKIKGLINIQFAIKNNKAFILEVNPRASRTIPFISKAKGIPYTKIATKVMAGHSLKNINLPDDSLLSKFYVKMPIFSFPQIPGASGILDSQMKSTGEVMGIGETLEDATSKAYLSSIKSIPNNKKVYIQCDNIDLMEFTSMISSFILLGFKIFINPIHTSILNTDKVKVLDEDILTKIHKENFSVIINTFSYNTRCPLYEKYKIKIKEDNIIECRTVSHTKGLLIAFHFLGKG